MAESSELSSHKGRKRRSFTMQFKQEVVELPQSTAIDFLHDLMWNQTVYASGKTTLIK